MPQYKKIADEFQSIYPNMYPEVHKLEKQFFPTGEEKPNTRVKSVTIVVTEDCPLRCTYCVSGDTLIKMADYTDKPIKDIKIGDTVLGFEENPKSHSRVDPIKSIVEQVYHRKAKVYKVVIPWFPDDKLLYITGNHKVFGIDENGTSKYIAIEDCIPGKTTLRCLYYGTFVYVPIKEKVEMPEEIDVYNIGTTTKTYFANDVYVHNCYQHAKNTNHKMTRETARKIVDLLFKEDAENNPYLNENNAQCILLEFIGGEPLLEIDLIDYFMRYFRWKAIQLNHRWAIHHMISISTNGILYNDPKVQSFIFKNKYRISITITIDGNKELHDSCRLFPDGSPSYDLVAKSMKRHTNYFGTGMTKLTLAPANISHAFEAIKNLYEEFHLDGVFANCVYEEGWTTEHGTILYYQLKQLADWMLNNNIEQDFFCTLFDESIGKPIEVNNVMNYCGGVAGQMLSFTADGYIQPCLRYTNFCLGGKRPELRVGDLETGILKREEYLNLAKDMDSITRKSQSTEECFNCPIAYGCGVCLAYNYEKYGTIDKRTTFICPTHKARVLANIYYWNKLYKKYEINKIFPLNIPDKWALEIISEEELREVKECFI